MTIGALTTAAILELAFKKILEAGAGELGRKYTSDALKLIDELYQKIRDRLFKKPEAKASIESVEQGETTDLTTVVPYLQAEMADDPDFAQEVRQLAQQIINIDTVQGQNVQNVFGGQGQQFNNDNINASVQQGTITNNNYYNASSTD